MNTDKFKCDFDVYESQDGNTELKIKFNYEMWLQVHKEHIRKLIYELKPIIAKEIFDELDKSQRYSDDECYFTEWHDYNEIKKEYGVE